MRWRRPNPWVAIPALVAGIVAGFVGWVVTDVSCRVEIAPGVIRHCPALSAAVAAGAFLMAVVGMAIVIVLVYRSLAEYQEARARDQEPPGPGCEA